MTGTPVRAVLLDVGGVLEITPSTRWQARWESRLGLASGEIDERLAGVYRAGTIGALTVAEVKQQVGALLSLAARDVDALLRDLWAEYLGTLNAPLLEWVRRLRPRVKTGILSNSWVGAREQEEAAYAFGSAFDAIVYSHEERIQKPDPRIYAIACERLDVRPDEVVFIDDLHANVEAARALGMRGVVFTGETTETLRALDALLRA